MPVRLHNPADHPFQSIPLVALAIGTPTRFVHVGILYRTEGNEIRLSHLLWHHVFRGSDAPDPSMSWIEAHFNDVVQEQLAAFLIHRAEQQERGEIPYSILQQGKSFDETGKYMSTSIGAGLTCATYILGVFEALDLSLVDLTSWPVGRNEDQEWFREILRLLEESKPPAAKEHIAAQRIALPNVVRCRPEEVAAAFSLFSDRKLGFEEVRPTSEEIIGLLPPRKAGNAAA